MILTLNSKGQITIPKQIRDAHGYLPGCLLQFSINQAGDVVMRKVGARASHRQDRFDAVRGTAEIKWRTDDLMALLRAEQEL